MPGLTFLYYTWLGFFFSIKASKIVGQLVSILHLKMTCFISILELGIFGILDFGVSVCPIHEVLVSVSLPKPQDRLQSPPRKQVNE